MADKMDTLEGFSNKLGFRIQHLRVKVQEWRDDIATAEKEIRNLEQERVMITSVIRDVQKVKESMDGQELGSSSKNFGYGRGNINT